MSNIPIGDPRPSGEEGPAGDQRKAGEEGPAGDPRPGGQAQGATDTFDPSAHTVDEVKTYMASAADAERERVIEAEKAGKNRASLSD